MNCTVGFDKKESLALRPFLKTKCAGARYQC
jgi:hypothetical protein